LPLLFDGMANGSARPSPSKATCGLEAAGIHRVTAARPGSRPGSFYQAPASQPGRGIASVMGTNDRDDRIGAHLLLR